MSTVFGSNPLHAQSTQNPTDYILDSNSTRSDYYQAIDFLEGQQLEPQSGIPQLVESIWNWSKTNGDSNDILQAQIERARYFNSIGLNSKSIAILNQVRKSKEASSNVMFSATIILRDIYFALDAYDKSMELHQEIDWSSSPDFYQTYAPECFLGFLYFKIGDYERAVKAMKSSIVKMEKSNKIYWQMSFTNSLGVIYEKHNRLDSAWVYYNRALTLLDSMFVVGKHMKKDQYEYTEGLFTGNLAQILAKKGRHLEAIPMFKLDISASINNNSFLESHENSITSLLKITESYLATDQIAKAKASIDHAEKIIQSNDRPDLWDHYYATRAIYYSYIDNPDSAYIALNSLVELRDSIQSHQKLVKSQNLLIAYESIIKDRDRAQKKQEIEILKHKAELQREVNIVFVFALIIALIIASISVYRFNRKNQQQQAIEYKNKEIEAQKKTIEHSLEEKETLLREVNHRVKNNLQIVSSLLFLQSRNITDQSLLQVMQDAQQRVQTMSMIHQKLYQESHFNNVDFGVYLTDIIQQIISSYQLNTQTISTDVNIEYNDVPMDQAVPLSLIVHELVTNSLKHAFTGKKEGLITISISRVNDQLKLFYGDDGNGLDADINTNKPSNIGMKVLDLLTKQLDGYLTIVQRNPLNIEFVFELDRS